MKSGRDPKKERNKARSGIIQALEDYPAGLGVRELRKMSGLKSNETLYKYLPTLLDEEIVQFSNVSVGRGKPKKVYRLTSRGQAYSIEFKVMDYFEKVREKCKANERFEIDNFAFSYSIYGMPKELTDSDKEQIGIALRRVNSALMELDELRCQIINAEAFACRRAVARVHAMVGHYITGQNMDKRTVVIDSELQKELDSYIPSSIKEKMKLQDNDDFALVVTRGPSFIDDYGLRPENQMLELLSSVRRWDEKGIGYVIDQLARNRYFDQEAIDRIKKWNNPNGRVTNFVWQQIKEQLDDIPKIREELKEAKEKFVQSGGIKTVLGLRKESCLVVTKELLGKEKLEELREELTDLENL
jgi:DNA-binding PadR family transcriptional regulator